MSAKPPPEEVLAFFDANPGKYKDAPEPDGYNPTKKLIGRLLKAPKIPNPVAQPDIPKPMDVQQLWDLLDSDEKAAIDSRWFIAMETAVGENNRDRIKRLVELAMRKLWIAAAKVVTIGNAVDATIPDPTWQAEVKGLNDLRANWPDEERGIHFKYIHQTVMGRA